MVNVNLRPGFFVGGVAFSEVMTFVDTEYQIFALFGQNELHQVEAGEPRRRSCSTPTGPHHQGARRLDHLGAGARTDGCDRRSARTTMNAPPGQLPVKLVVSERDKDLFLAASTRGESGDLYGTLQADYHTISFAR